MRMDAVPLSFSLSFVSLGRPTSLNANTVLISEAVQRARQRRFAACLAGARRRRRPPVTALLQRRRIRL
jgi:hypothetical protein